MRAAPAQVDAVVASGGQALDAATRAYFEPRFGHDFGRVRVHHDAAAAASARAVDAVAYTVGEHVVFDQGRYAPASPAGRRLLAHELTHVVQQGGLLRRSSESPRVRGGTPDAPDRDDDEDQAAPPVQRLQRTPAIVGLDEAGPKADLSGEHEGEQLDRIGACLKQKGPDPDECSPPRALTWADFTAAPVMSSSFGAVTYTEIKKIDIKSQECVESVLGRTTGPKRLFQGYFGPDKSWVKPNMLNAADPTKNGSAALAAKCKTDMDAAVAKGIANPTWALSTATDPTCPASVRPAGTPATSKAECDTTIVTDFTTRAVAESARLLNHEHFHYKLACALAKKANGMVWRGADFAALDAVKADKRTKTQQQYDDESHHGCDAANQAKWEAEVAAGLPSVVLP
ncbi:MAG: DUF4157 domain-containing protein [Proteobacteria bacterium]|nr:DUF4157 domain-containing protein [Pseudomonadota bacterium]